MKHISRLLAVVMLVVSLCPSFPAFTADTAAAEDGLVGYWKLDDGALTVGSALKEEVDNGDWGNTEVLCAGWGSALGTGTGVDGNSSLRVSGMYAKTEKIPKTLLDQNDKMTFSLWFKTPETIPTGEGFIFGIGPNGSAAMPVQWNLCCGQNKGFTWEVKQWNATGGVGGYAYTSTLAMEMLDKSSIQPNTWYHVALVTEKNLPRASDNAKVGVRTDCYLNGELKATRIVDWQINGLESFFKDGLDYRLIIGGALRGSSGDYVNGSGGYLDEIKIYNNDSFISSPEFEGIKSRHRISGVYPANGEASAAFNPGEITLVSDKTIEGAASGNAEFFAKNVRVNGENVRSAVAQENKVTLGYGLDYMTFYEVTAPVFGIDGLFGKVAAFTTQKPPVYAMIVDKALGPGTGEKSVKFNFTVRDTDTTSTILANVKNGRIIGKADIVTKAEEGIKTADLTVDSTVDGAELKAFNWDISTLKPVTKVVDDGTAGEIALLSGPTVSNIMGLNVLPSSDRFSFSGRIGESGKEVTVAVLKPGATTISEDTLCGIKQLTAESDGSFSTEIEIDTQGESGYYRYIVSGENVSTPESDVAYFASAQDLEGIITSINNAASADTVRNIFEGENKDENLLLLYSMGVDETEYKKVNGNNDSMRRISKKLWNGGTDYPLSGAPEIAAVVNDAVKLEKTVNLSLNERKTYITELLESEGFDADAVGYSKLSEAELSWFFDNLEATADETLESIAALKAYADEMPSVAIVNFDEWQNISNSIAKYKSVIETSAGTTISKTLTDELCKAVQRDEDNRFTSAATLVKFINDFVPAGGSGGASGGSTAKGGNAGLSGITVSPDLIGKTDTNVSTGVNNAGVHTRLSDIGAVDWAKDKIQKLFSRGIVSGDENGRFNPENDVSRAELVKMIVEAFGLEENGKPSNFSDIASDAWYRDYVSIAAAHGIVLGANGRFNPEAFATRQDIAVILTRAMSFKEITPETTDIEEFSDINDAADYAAEAIRYLRQCKVIRGFENKFLPKNNCTRAEMACMLSDILDLMD